MRPKRPTDLLDTLIATVLHPVRSMEDQIARGDGWEEAPWRFWGVLAFVAIAGSFIFGASLALALPAAGSWAYAAIALAASAGVGWVLFGVVLLGMARKPIPHLAHASLVTMLFGEAVLELGVIANLLLRDFPGALILNIAIVALSNVIMLAVLVAQLRVLKMRTPLVIAIWFGILNTAGLAVFRIFYPEFFSF
jgi:hypothetical protein